MAASLETREKNGLKVFVGNLDFKVDNDQLAALFSPYGTVVGVNLRMDRGTGRPRGFGFVTFTSESEASAAVEAMNGRMHHDRALTVNSADIRGGGKEKERPDWLTTPDVRPTEVRAQPHVVLCQNIDIFIIANYRRHMTVSCVDAMCPPPCFTYLCLYLMHVHGTTLELPLRPASD